MTQKSRGPKPKHIPQRTCIACRQVAGKRSLLRVVRAETGIVIDPTGKLAGRGAYLHPYQECWRAALRSNRLEQALRTRLSEENRQTLLTYMATLPETEAAVENEAVNTAENDPAALAQTAAAGQASPLQTGGQDDGHPAP